MSEFISLENMSEIIYSIPKRNIIEYTEEEKDDNADSVQEFVTGMRRLRRKGKSISFINQRKKDTSEIITGSVE